MSSDAPLAKPIPAGQSAAFPPVEGGELRLSDWRECAGQPDIAMWDALALMASEPNPFFESWYLLPSLQAFDPDGRIGLLRLEAGGTLLGLMPIERTSGYYGHRLPHIGNWLHANCFLGSPLVAAGAEEAFWRALLTWSDRHAGLGLFLHIAQLPLSGPIYDALKRVLASQSRKAALAARENRALLASAKDAGTYWDDALSAKKRKELRRQHKRLSEHGVLAFHREAGEDGLAEWTADYLDLEIAGWKGQEGSALACSATGSAIFAEALTGAASRGRLERLSLTLDGRPIAMLSNFLTAPGAFAYKTAFDEAYARFSPGVLLQRENLALLDRDDIAWCDSCAAADHPMIDHVWRERRAIGRINIAIGGTARRAAFAGLARAETGAFPGDLP